MSKINKIWTFIEDFLAGSFFVAGILVIFYGVIMRYIFKASPQWVGEVSIYLLVWAALLGISVALRNDRHIKVTIIYDFLSDGKKKMIDFFVVFVSIVFTVFYTYYGLQLVIARFSSGMVSLDVGIPMWIVYLILPISGLLFLIRLIENLVRLISGRGIEHDNSIV